MKERNRSKTLRITEKMEISKIEKHTKKDNGSNKRSRAKNMIIILIRDVWSTYVCKKKDETTRY